MSDCCNKIKVRSEDEKKDLQIRLNRIIGQLNGIKKMIDEDRYCNDILIQLLSVDKSIKSLSNQILDNHMHSCLIESINNGDDSVVDEIMEMIKRFL